MKRITKATSYLLLVSLVLIGLGETDSLVLCIGRDGHIALEDSRTGICSHTLDQIAEELGLPADHDVVRKIAQCCPCADMDLPGHDLDYPEILPPDVVYITEPAETPTPVFELAFSELLCTPCGDFVSLPPPPDLGDSASKTALRSVVILA
ncbi:MAG: hypothetical protein HN350_04145 [Phycisphaerales bacterium]|jgi:hypothetical protein|nr:hypothetical protein [Phycisphaerales bacterium]